MTRVLVTGATGYVGSQLVKRLVAKGTYEVSVLVRPSSDLSILGEALPRVRVHASEGDVESLGAVLAEARPEVVLHLASLFLSQHVAKDVVPLIQSNVQFGTCLLEAMVQQGVRCFVNTGTAWETMDGPPGYRPVCLYAATKRAFEDILRFYEDAYDVSAITLKLFDTYGPEDPRPKLFTLLKKSATMEAPIPFSPGEQVLDLTHVEDVTDAFERAIHHVLAKVGHAHEALEIGSGQGLALKEVVRLYEAATGQKANIAWGERPYRPREVMRAEADPHEAERVLGWRPLIELEDGLRRVFGRVATHD